MGKADRGRRDRAPGRQFSAAVSMGTVAGYAAFGLQPARSHDERVKEITALGIRYNLLTAYTSFVAVDTQARRQGGDSVTVKQPLPLPQGVSDNALPGGPPYALAMPSSGLAYSNSGGLLKARTAARSGSHLAMDARVRKEAHAGPESEPAEKGQQEELVIESLKVEGGLTEETVRRIIEQNLAPILQCFGGHIPRTGLTLELVIGKTGSVVSVHAASGAGADKTMLGCARRQAANWRFPAPGNGGKVHVRVTLGIKK